MEVVGYDVKKVLWEVVEYHVVEEVKDHDDIELRGFGFNLFDFDEQGVVRERLSEYPYLLMLIKLQPGYCKNQLERINKKVDEENVKAAGMVNIWYQKFRRF